MNPVDLESMAARLAVTIHTARGSRKPARQRDSLELPTEYSCQVDISLTADFEGDVARNHLLKKLESEILAAIKAGVASTAKAYGLQATNILLKPVRIECAVNDPSSANEDPDDVGEPDYDPPPASSRTKPRGKAKAKKRRR